MAGNRQHFLPKFLQKGFGFEPAKAKGQQVWVYAKNRKPYPTNIINSGAEVHFNTVDGDPAADDLVTAKEGKLSATVEQLRDSRSPLPPSEDLAELLGHLEATTRNFRLSFEHSASILMRKMREHLANEETLKALLLRRLKEDPLLTKTLPDIPPDVAGVIAPLLPAMLEANVAQFVPIILQLMDGLMSQASVIVKKGHVSALLKTAAGNVRSQLYAHLDYTVERISSERMILGDSGVFFRIAGERPWKPFFDKGDRVLAAILPVTSSLVLVGRGSDFVFDASEVCAAAARCSREFFVASTQSDTSQGLQNQIGLDSDPLTPSQLDAIAQELFKR